MGRNGMGEGEVSQSLGLLTWGRGIEGADAINHDWEHLRKHSFII